MNKTREFFAHNPIKDSKIFWERTCTQQMIKECLQTQAYNSFNRSLITYLTWLAQIKLDEQHLAKIHEMDTQLPFFQKLWLTELSASGDAFIQTSLPL